ncbi:helicase POLQ-like isoform X2 [Macrosteles quadrilineatus]|uniref:helicase POLQ-like isoform X2 n=1 Tax=Macrosteles quadrilineatus TaxID=74068 RepID=UPI0023E3413D|nr:helicase POLQ-like isoform X2 [Macrosteles quadrilineatus]
MKRIKGRSVGLSRVNKSFPVYSNDYCENNNVRTYQSDKIVIKKSPFVMTKSESNPSSEFNSLCSHEKLKIEFHMSSGEFKSASISGKSVLEENKLCKNDNCLIDQETMMEDDLLKLDDSLLEKIDLSFSDATLDKTAKKQCFGLNSEVSIKGIQPLSEIENKIFEKTNQKIYKESPDIFCNTENNEEDKPWDMSITVEDKDGPFPEQPQSASKKLLMSPGLSDLILDTWVPSREYSSQREGKRLSFEGMIKNALSNNAHKTASPKPLLTSCSNCSSSSFFGLPEHVKSLIKRYKGIQDLYKWQEECLNLPAIKKRKNLVYALPTSGGKTLVAEILILKEIMCREKNVLFVLPYVSLAQEKVRALSPFALELGFIVEEYAGSKGGYPPQKRRRKRSVYVATIEKALGLVHSLIECERIEELGLIVVDELHLVGEPKRGAHLESMLTKMMYRKGSVQIIGMSATIGNLRDIATFLHADVFTQDFRPVELTEFVKVEEELFKVDYSIEEEVPLVFQSKISFEYSQEQKQKDPDQVGALVLEVIPEHSCLVFCPSKKNCENVASLICNVLGKNIIEHKIEEKKALFRALVSEGNGTVCPILRKTLPYGIAYHHSGLTTAERNLLEEAFLAKTICCICCTSTLAAGVNLPARRVILRSPYVGAQLLTLSKYKQMVGRAGRTGMGDIGESFLLCKPQDAQKVGELLSSSMDLCNSQLEGTGLACLIISAVDLGLAATTSALHSLCHCTLLAVQATRLSVDLASLIGETVDTLVNSGAMVVDGDLLKLSKIGKAAVKANLDMDTAHKLYRDLKVAQDGLVLLSHLHLLYLVIPYPMLELIPFQQRAFCDSYMALGSKDMQTAKVLGIKESCIAQMMQGRLVKFE